MMIFGYVCLRIVVFKIAGHFEKKNDAHELKNEETGRKMFLSRKFHGVKEEPTRL